MTSCEGSEGVPERMTVEGCVGVLLECIKMRTLWDGEVRIREVVRQLKKSGLGEA